MVVMLADFIRSVRLVAGNGSRTGMQKRSCSRDVGGQVEWLVCVIPARRMPGGPSARIVELCGEPWIAGGPGGRPHKVFVEQVHVTGRASVDNPVRNVARVVSEVPVVQRQLWISLAEQLLAPVGELTVPRQKLRTIGHGGRLRYIGLCKPTAYAPWRSICRGARVVSSVQFGDRPHKQTPLLGIHLCDISPHPIA